MYSLELEDIEAKRSSFALSETAARNNIVLTTQQDSSSTVSSNEVFRVYKRRWLGLLGTCLLNIVSGLCWLWFSAIAVDTSQEFGISLERVNWLGNIVNLIYLPVSVVVPLVCSRWGLRTSLIIGSLSLLASSWIRYAGTSQDLDADGKYALLLVGQIFTGFAQPWFQILGPRYSETWFAMSGRTTATMLIAIAGPIGGALSQLIAPAFSTVSDSVLILAIITSAVTPTVLLIGSKPPVPPSHAGSQNSPPLMQILRALVGRARQGEAFMSPRERADMVIITLLFGSLVGAFSAFSILISQIFTPHGYSSDEAGIMGGVLILAGIVGAAIFSPLVDRYLSNRLALVAKALVPLLAACYISLIWDVQPNNYAGIYVVMVLIGVSSFTLLPIALEIGCEVTRSAETSSAMLWFTGNLLSVTFALSMAALRDDSPDASPPSNMLQSLIFLGCFIGAVAISVFGLKAERTRQELGGGVSSSDE
ncbi:major facilitator superfamily transporter [Rhizoctonia solani]|uniref:Major facilitator superfamily transporter n=1 Tax=Rhizoctonia solani TaxID=456999 RepID=A0A8H8NVE9_9AGAM|nr:major facilitator superfamily transporter [Rhizoctonia solani]QRW20791.1 major facilitator superfamily transporter [Rhizoctonia solani]